MQGTSLKSGARNLIRANSPKIFFVSIIYIIILTVMSEFQFRLPGTLDAYDQYLQQLSSGAQQDFNMIYSYFRPSGLPFALVLWLLSPVVQVGYMSYGLKISRGEDGEYKDILNGFLFFGKIIVLHIVTSALVFLWSLLFVFPGIAAHYRYRQSYYVLMDDPKKGVFQCIGESKRLMRGKKIDLFMLDLSFFGWYVLDILVAMFLPVSFSLPIVSVWLTPYLGLTRAAFYNQLVNNTLSA